MEIGLILLKQIIIMFILMALGYWMFKKGMITKQGSKDLGTLMVNIVIPAIIIKSFWIESTTEKINVLIITFFISIASLLISIFISALFFKKDGLSQFASAFSNAGFIGIPLVSATLGEEAVFYIACFIAQLNVLQWTYGVYIMTKDKKTLNFKNIMLHPLVLSLCAGLLVFLLNIPQPEIISSTLSLISGLNTPIAMIISGVYLAQANFQSMITSLSLYQLSFVRLIFIPFVTLIFLSLLTFVSYDVKVALFIAASAPTGANVAIYAQLYHKDYRQAVLMVCLTTLLSIVTLPVMISIGSLFIGG